MPIRRSYENIIKHNLQVLNGTKGTGKVKTFFLTLFQIKKQIGNFAGIFHKTTQIAFVLFSLPVDSVIIES